MVALNGTIFFGERLHFKGIKGSFFDVKNLIEIY